MWMIQMNWNRINQNCIMPLHRMPIVWIIDGFEIKFELNYLSADRKYLKMNDYCDFKQLVWQHLNKLVVLASIYDFIGDLLHQRLFMRKLEFSYSVIDSSCEF